MHKIQIDSEFQALIPPLSAEERAQLEANIVADGCRDPLVVWPSPEFTHVWDEETGESETFKYADKKVNFIDGDSPEGFDFWESSIYGDTYDGEDWPRILIDGHNRYEICTRLGLPFEVVQKEFESRDNATEWIINNQFGRRNLSDYQRGVLALRMKPIIEARALAARLEGNSSGGKSSEKSHETTTDIFTGQVKQATPIEAPKPSIRTDEAVANLANISSNTIRKIERIEEVAAPEVKALAAAGDVSINLAAQFADLPQETQQEALAAIAQSEPAKEVMREAVKKAHVANNSGNNEWYTPPKFIELARQAMGGIDLDPATSEVANRTVQATKIFTADDDGRAQQWNGRVFMNPPYAQPLMGDFAEAVASKYESGEIDQACILVNNGTETQWFQRMLGAADAVCFPKTRIKFFDPSGNPSGAPLQGQAILYMGENVAAFASLFAEEGVVLTHA